MAETTNAVSPSPVARMPAVTMHNMLSFVIAVENIPCLGSVSRSWRTATREPASWTGADVVLLTLDDAHMNSCARPNSWFTRWRSARRVVLHARHAHYAILVNQRLSELWIENPWREWGVHDYPERPLFVSDFEETTGHALITEHHLGNGFCILIGKVEGRGNPVNNLELGFTNIYPDALRFRRNAPGRHCKIGVHFDLVDVAARRFILRTSYESDTVLRNYTSFMFNFDQFRSYDFTLELDKTKFDIKVEVRQRGRTRSWATRVPVPKSDRRFLSRHGRFHAHLLVRDAQHPLPRVTLYPDIELAGPWQDPVQMLAHP